MKRIYLLTLTVLLFSCDKEDEPPEYPNLSIYIDRFVEEAKDRGFEFDLSGLEAVYVDDIDLDGNKFCGYGYWDYKESGNRRIEISRSANCDWKNRSDTERENLFFHEIGHAFLRRLHDETLLCDGKPMSLMASANGLGWQFYTESEIEKRDYYITELMDRLSATGECIDYGQNWATDPLFYQDIDQDNEWYFHSDNNNYSGNKGFIGGDPTKPTFTIQQIDGTSTSNTGFWLRQFNNPNIPQCANVKLKVSMSSEMLEGSGAAIALRAYHSPPKTTGAANEEYLVLSTEETNPLTGTFSRETRELEIDCFSRDTDYLIIFIVMLPGSKGVVNIDDVEIVVTESLG
jgi:hypothetical protein